MIPRGYQQDMIVRLLSLDKPLIPYEIESENAMISIDSWIVGGWSAGYGSGLMIT